MHSWTCYVAKGRQAGTCANSDGGIDEVGLLLWVVDDDIVSPAHRQPNNLVCTVFSRQAKEGLENKPIQLFPSDLDSAEPGAV
jgi:hypothetical protein